MKISNLKIGVRLGLGFGMVLTLMMALALIGVFRMAQIEKSLETIVGENNSKIKAIGEMRQDVMIVSVAVRNMALLTGEDQIKDEADRIADARDDYKLNAE